MFWVCAGDDQVGVQWLLRDCSSWSFSFPLKTANAGQKLSDILCLRELLESALKGR